MGWSAGLVAARLGNWGLDGWGLGRWGVGRGLRSSLLLWTTLVSSAALLAGACWIHFNLRYVLEDRVDQFLERKLIELRATAQEHSSQPAFDRLAAEIRHVAAAYRDQRLALVVRSATQHAIAPDDADGRQVAERLSDFSLGVRPRTILIPADRQAFRASSLLPWRPTNRRCIWKLPFRWPSPKPRSTSSTGWSPAERSSFWASPF